MWRFEKLCKTLILLRTSVSSRTFRSNSLIIRSSVGAWYKIKILRSGNMYSLFEQTPRIIHIYGMALRNASGTGVLECLLIEKSIHNEHKTNEISKTLRIFINILHCFLLFFSSFMYVCCCCCCCCSLFVIAGIFDKKFREYCTLYKSVQRAQRTGHIYEHVEM